MKMKESGGMSLQNIGERHSQSLVKGKEDMFLLGMKEKQEQYIIEAHGTTMSHVKEPIID